MVACLTRSGYCWGTNHYVCSLLLVEGTKGGPSVVLSLSQPIEKGQVLVRSLNLSAQYFTLKASSTLSTFSGIELDSPDKYAVN